MGKSKIFKSMRKRVSEQRKNGILIIVNKNPPLDCVVSLSKKASTIKELKAKKKREKNFQCFKEGGLQL